MNATIHTIHNNGSVPADPIQDILDTLGKWHAAGDGTPRAVVSPGFYNQLVAELLACGHLIGPSKPDTDPDPDFRVVLFGLRIYVDGKRALMPGEYLMLTSLPTLAPALGKCSCPLNLILRSGCKCGGK